MKSSVINRVLIGAVTLAVAGTVFSVNADAKTKAKKKVNVPTPAVVDTSDVSFADRFTSDTENSLTIKWPKAGKATGYEVTATVTGTTDEQSVITKVDNAKVEKVYSGKSNTAVITVPRNTMYSFQIRSYAKKGKTKKNSAWSEVDYFPATDDIVSRNDEKYEKFIKRFQIFFGGKDNCSVHGNVLTMKSDYQFVDPEKKGKSIHDFTDKYDLEENNPEVIIDFAGHTLTGHFDMGCQSPLVFTDSVGGGGITDTEQGYIGIGSNGNIIINGGNYIANSNSPISVGGQKYDIYHGFCMRIDARYQKVIINGGKFSNPILCDGYGGPLYIINGGTIDVTNNTEKNGILYAKGGPKIDIKNLTLHPTEGTTITKDTVGNFLVLRAEDGTPEVNVENITWQQ